MALYEITKDALVDIAVTTFDIANIKERTDLQRLLRERVEVVSPDTMVIAEEFGDWEDSRRRIDLLGIDRSGKLVVIELKRTDDGGFMDLQAVRYAAMVSTMTFEQVVAAHAAFLARLGRTEDARKSILDFLGWDEPDEEAFAQDVRIVLASAEFSKELTTAVMWLNERDLDIQCVRLRPYLDNGRVLLDVQRVIPLPEAEEYQVRARAKATQERQARQEHGTLGERYRRFWTELLPKARAKTDLHRDISPSPANWSAATSHGLYFSYVIGRDGPRVELYLTRQDAEENLAIFRDLEAHKEQIEAAYGGRLSWEPLEGKTACRVAAPVAGLPFKDEANWPALQDAMIEAMIRLERALAPHISDYRAGGSAKR